MAKKLILIDFLNLFPFSERALKFIRRRGVIAPPSHSENGDPHCFICGISGDVSNLEKRSRYRKDVYLCQACLPFYERLFDPPIHLPLSEGDFKKTSLSFWNNKINSHDERYPDLLPQINKKKFIINCRHDLILDSCAICREQEGRKPAFPYFHLKLVQAKEDRTPGRRDLNSWDEPGRETVRPKSEEDRFESPFEPYCFRRAVDRQLGSRWEEEPWIPPGVEIVWNSEEREAFCQRLEKRAITKCEECTNKSCARTGAFCRDIKRIWKRLDRFSLPRMADRNFEVIEELESQPTAFQGALQEEEIEERRENEIEEKERRPWRKLRKELSGAEGIDIQIKWSSYYGISHVIPEAGYQATEMLQEDEPRLEDKRDIVEEDQESKVEKELAQLELEKGEKLPVLPNKRGLRKGESLCEWCSKPFLLKATEPEIMAKIGRTVLPTKCPFIYRFQSVCPFCQRNRQGERVIPRGVVPNWHNRGKNKKEREFIEDLFIDATDDSKTLLRNPKAEIKEYLRQGYSLPEIIEFKGMTTQDMETLFSPKGNGNCRKKMKKK